MYRKKRDTVSPQQRSHTRIRRNTKVSPKVRIKEDISKTQTANRARGVREVSDYMESTLILDERTLILACAREHTHT